MNFQFCNGGDLHSYLRKNGKLSEETIKIFLQQIGKFDNLNINNF